MFDRNGSATLLESSRSATLALPLLTGDSVKFTPADAENPALAEVQRGTIYVCMNRVAEFAGTDSEFLLCLGDESDALREGMEMSLKTLNLMLQDIAAARDALLEHARAKHSAA